MSAVCFQILLIARNTFTEAVRQKLFHFLLILGVGLVASSQLFRHFNFGHSELKFIFDFGFGGIWIFGSILAIVATVQLVFGEFEQKTALTLLAKPLRRGTFLLGKGLGIALLLAVYMALMGCLLAGVLFLREQGMAPVDGVLASDVATVDYTGLAIFVCLQWLRLLMIAALTLLVVCISTTHLYAVIVSFFMLMIGQLQYIARETAQSGAGMGEFLLNLIVWLFPNMQLFNVGETLVLGVGSAFPTQTLWGLIGYALIYTVAYMLLALFVFRTREL